MEEYDHLYAVSVPIDEHSDLAHIDEEDCSNGTLPLSAAVLGTPTEDGRRRILVPEVITMTKFLFDHHKNLMLRYLNECLQDGDLHSFVPFSFTTGSFTRQNCRFDRVYFWRQDRTRFIADVEVTLDLETESGTRSWDAYLSLWYDSDDLDYCSIEEFGARAALEPRELTPLSPFLIPIYTNHKMDLEMESVLATYHCKEAGLSTRERAARLAANMGLRIEYLPVHDHQGIPSILFFAEDKLEILDRHAKRSEKPVIRSIAPNTIVVNSNYINPDYSDFHIFHECAHHEEHYMFFKLQEMSTNDVRQMKTHEVKIQQDEKVTSPLYWMEIQANRGAYGLMMPYDSTRALIQRHLKAECKYSNPSEQLDHVGRHLMDELGLPYFRVRARLIQLGYIYARGALNKADGVYIEPFCFDPDSWRNDRDTFVIDSKTARVLHDKSEDFRVFIDSGKYIYADGHVVKNDSRYVEKRLGELKLTEEARAAINRCCLRFVRLYVQKNLERYVYGRMYFDADYVTQTKFYLEDAINKKGMDELQAEVEYKRNFPTTFREAFHLLRKKNGYSMDDMAELLHISTRSLERIIADPDHITLDFITFLTLCWKLPDWLSNLLLDRAYIRLSETNQRHNAIRFIMRAMWMDGVDKANQYLDQKGLPMLGF